MKTGMTMGRGRSNTLFFLNCELLLFWISAVLLATGHAEHLHVQWSTPIAEFPDDFDTEDLRKVGGTLKWEKQTFSVNNPARQVTGYAAYVDDPSRFHFSLPIKGCGHRVKTSVTAAQSNCVYATNAGFFDMHTGDCMGSLVSEKQEIQLVDQQRVIFGVLGNQLLVGYINLSSLKRLPPFEELISGAGWLVRSSKSVVNTSRVKESLEENFVMEKAPRTGLAVLSSGQLLILQVDGVEEEKEGVDLYEFADCFRSLNATQAVNLDGGGSSVSWAAGHGIIDHPTCTDTPLLCERAVTSIVCVK